MRSGPRQALIECIFYQDAPDDTLHLVTAIITALLVAAIAAPALALYQLAFIVGRNRRPPLLDRLFKSLATIAATSPKPKTPRTNGSARWRRVGMAAKLATNDTRAGQAGTTGIEAADPSPSVAAPPLSQGQADAAVAKVLASESPSKRSALPPLGSKVGASRVTPVAPAPRPAGSGPLVTLAEARPQGAPGLPGGSKPQLPPIGLRREGPSSPPLQPLPPVGARPKGEANPPAGRASSPPPSPPAPPAPVPAGQYSRISRKRSMSLGGARPPPVVVADHQPRRSSLPMGGGRYDPSTPESPIIHTRVVTDTETQRLRDVFDRHDVDKSGSIDVEELAGFMADLGEPFDRWTRWRVLRALDKDRSGKIDFEELHLWYAAKKKVRHHPFAPRPGLLANPETLTHLRPNVPPGPSLFPISLARQGAHARHQRRQHCRRLQLSSRSRMRLAWAFMLTTNGVLCFLIFAYGVTFGSRKTMAIVTSWSIALCQTFGVEEPLLIGLSQALPSLMESISHNEAVGSCIHGLMASMVGRALLSLFNAVK